MRARSWGDSIGTRRFGEEVVVRTRWDDGQEWWSMAGERADHCRAILHLHWICTAQCVLMNIFMKNNVKFHFFGTAPSPNNV